ncbi:MAG: undecaprenyl-diphosphate phosphatase, partial [Rhodospirillales bacterium]|nr:undecaprenyl-diphosphate phosphatase [Rhodospirillales bacterium]
GIVEGLTEFIPVSSTGHILLMESLLGFEGPPGNVFDIVIQTGAILAVCWLYRVKLWRTVVGLFRNPIATRFALNVAIGFLPAAVIGIAAHGFIKRALFNPWVVAVSLIVGGVAILIIERMAPRPSVKTVDDIDWKLALKIGLCQCVAMIPGVSRSGATIMGARLFGADRAAAAEFSFFLAIPTLIGAAAYDTYKNWSTLAGDGQAWTAIGVGFVVSFIVALPVVKWLIGFVSRYGFGPFAWYRIVVGVATLALLATLGGR